MKVSKCFLLSLFLVLALSVTSSHAGLLGPAGDYNAFVFGDMTVWESDSQGRIASGGIMDVEAYGIGSLASSGVYSIIGGGNVDFTDGAVQNGGIFSAGNITLLDYYVNGDLTANGTISGILKGSYSGTATAGSGDALPIDFASAYISLESTSNTLRDMTANGIIDITPDDEITLTGTHDVNIFNLTGSDLDDAASLAFDVNADSVSIVNVSGSVNSFSDFAISGADNLYNNILYNFHNSSNLTIANMSVKGSLLATDADVFFNSANIDGTLVAGSLTGTGEFHQHLFNPDVPVVPEPVSSTLFIIGGAALGFRRFRKK